MKDIGSGWLMILGLTTLALVVTLLMLSTGTGGRILPTDADVCAGRATPIASVSATCDPP